MSIQAVYTLRVETAQAQADMERFFTSVGQQTARRTGAQTAGAAGGMFAEQAAGFKMLQAGVAAFVGSKILNTVATTTIELIDLGREARRAGVAFEYMSGGANNAKANLDAVRRASQYTVDTITAQEIATSALALGLAKDADELERIVLISRGIVAVSPTINTVQQAFQELGLTLANTSWRRLDQLGLSVAEVKDNMEQLRATNSALTFDQAFQQSVIDMAERKYKDLALSADFAATGLEKLRATWRVTRAEMGKDLEKDLDPAFRFMESEINRMNDKIAAADALGAQSTNRNRREYLLRQISGAQEWYGMQQERGDDRVQLAATAAEIELARRELKSVTQAWMEASVAVAMTNDGIREQAEAMGGLTDAINPALQTVEKFVEVQDRFRNYGAMMTGAPDPMFVDGASSSSLNFETKNLRLAEKLAGLIKDFDEAAALGVPGMDEWANAMRDVGEEVRTTGRFTSEHIGIMSAATRMWYQGGEAAYFLAGALGNVEAALFGIAEIGPTVGGFLMSGGLTADGLIRYPTSPESFQQKEDTIKASMDAEESRFQAKLGIQQNENEQAKERQRLDYETAQKARAAWERAAKDAARAFENALSAIEGLFGTSKVTEEDMADAAAGIYQTHPDEYLRRLRDEVYNKKDYEGVDIRDAAQRIGLDPNLPPETILRKFEQAWADSSLFAGGQNLDLVDREAVQRELDRQKESESGRQALMGYFGLETNEAGTAIGTAFKDSALQEAPAIGAAIASGMQGSESQGSVSADAQVKAMTSSMKAAMNTDSTKEAFIEVGKQGLMYVFTGMRDGDLLKELATKVLEEVYGAISDAMDEDDGGE